jgi:hypothetical protein
MISVGLAHNALARESWCVSKSCSLWPYRFGRNPTDELKAEVADQVLHPAEREPTGKDLEPV